MHQTHYLSSQLKKKTSKTVPFGWKLYPNKEGWLLPKEDEQETLNYIHDIKNNVSLRTISDVIYAKHGRRMSPNGVKKMLNRGYK